MCPSLIEIGSKTAEKNCTNKQTDKQSDKQTDRQTVTTKIMVTWPWTNFATYSLCNERNTPLDQMPCHLFLSRWLLQRLSITVTAQSELATVICTWVTRLLLPRNLSDATRIPTPHHPHILPKLPMLALSLIFGPLNLRKPTFWVTLILRVPTATTSRLNIFLTSQQATNVRRR